MHRIADHAADQTAVRSRNTVVLIDIELGKRADVDLIHVFLRKRCIQFLVQAVNAFHNEDIIGPEFQHIASVFAVTRLEIIVRQFDFFAFQECIHVAVKQRRVNAVQIFEIIVSEFVLRIILTVHEIVIHADRMRNQTMRAKLNAEAIGKRRFSGARRTRDHHELHALALLDLARDLRDLLLLQGFLHQNQLLDRSVYDGFVQITDRVYTDLRGKYIRFDQCMGDLMLRLKRRDLIRFLLDRHLQHDPVLVEMQVEMFQVTGGRHHITVKIVAETVNLIQVHAADAAEPE